MFKYFLTMNTITKLQENKVTQTLPNLIYRYDNMTFSTVISKWGGWIQLKINQCLTFKDAGDTNKGEI